MPRHILLLRGINLGARNRIAMPALREALEDEGFEDVRTYLQSGNIVLSSRKTTAAVTRACAGLIAERFGLDIAVVARSAAELAEVVERNPLRDVARDPKRYQVSFLAAKPSAAVLRLIEEAALPPERAVAIGREIYGWHPQTIARSRLWTLLAGKQLGVTATARNWTTVTNLLALAQE